MKINKNVVYAYCKRQDNSYEDFGFMKQPFTAKARNAENQGAIPSKIQRNSKRGNKAFKLC